MFTIITIVTLSLITIAALVAIRHMSQQIASLKRENDSLVHTIEVKDERYEKLLADYEQTKHKRYDWLVERYNRLLGDYGRSSETILRVAKQRAELFEENARLKSEIAALAAEVELPW